MHNASQVSLHVDHAEVDSKTEGRTDVDELRKVQRGVPMGCGQVWRGDDQRHPRPELDCSQVYSQTRGNGSQPRPSVAGLTDGFLRPETLLSQMPTVIALRTTRTPTSRKLYARGRGRGVGGSDVEDHNGVVGLAQRLDVVYHSSNLFVHEACSSATKPPSGLLRKLCTDGWVSRAYA